MVERRNKNSVRGVYKEVSVSLYSKVIRNRVSGERVSGPSVKLRHLPEPGRDLGGEPVRRQPPFPVLLGLRGAVHARFAALVSEDSEPQAVVRHDDVREPEFGGCLMKKVIVDKNIAHGEPVIEGTRVPVAVILGSLADGMTTQEIMREYDLTEDELRAALKCASDHIK